MKKNKENAMAKHPKKETAAANNSKKAAKNTLKKVRIISGVAWLGLPYNVNQEVEVGKGLTVGQAQDLIDNNSAEDIS